MTRVVNIERQHTVSSEEVFRDIIAHERVHSVFQPIVDIRKHGILGYEALIRGPEHSEFSKPIQLFDMAATLGMGTELEIMCRKNSIREYAELGLGSRLFLNISPGALLNPNFKKGKTLQYLQEFGIHPDQVVIELTEQQQTKGYRLLAEALAHYRNMGFTVALDDLGAGYSGLRLWTELLPDYIKIDKHFVRNIHTDRIKASFVASLHRMSAVSNCQIIVEGVEQFEELKTLQKIGITFAQGYYFARPEKTPPVAIDAAKFAQCIWEEHFQEPETGNSDLARIARRVEPKSAGMTVNQIVDYLQKKPDLELLPVLDGERPVGIINRHQFFNKLMASRFVLELYGKHPISKLLEEKVILVDIDSDLESVSQRVTSTPVPEQAFIIMAGAQYHGVATVLDLLEVITEQKIQNARHSNPLTLLPGMVPVNSVINKMLGERRSFSVAYFDLDNFKPYNDYYGYAAGDRIIQLLAGLLKRHYHNSSALIGHIGGDDFIVMDTDAEFLATIELVLAGFAEALPDYYERGHVREAGIRGFDRHGQESFFGLTSVSVGIVPPAAVATCQSHIDIADLASEAKKMAKQLPGNSYFINRRAIVRV